MSTHELQNTQRSVDLNSPAARYGEWPYYLQPEGWVPRPGVPEATHWTQFRPTGSWTATHTNLFARTTGYPASEMMFEIIRRDPIGGPPRSPVEQYEMPPPSRDQGASGFAPSAMFARVPSAGRMDSNFCLYRYAQYASDSNLDHPVAHPALQCYNAMTGPDLLWDLTANLCFPYIGRSNIVPFYPEEFDTYLTHPPLSSIEVRFDILPVLSFVLRATGGFGVTIRDFMENVTKQLARPFTLAEWNSHLTQEQRGQVLHGYQRRTGEQFDVARRARETVRENGGSAAARGETNYLVSDMLADEPMFLGIAMEDEDPAVWTVYTCRREQCHAYLAR